MALQGNIDSFSVVDVLRLLGSSGKTGRLFVEGDRTSVSLWLADGYLSGASITREGEVPSSADPAEVLFDVMRFAEGSFVFEADLLGGDMASPIDVADAVDMATAAMEEWTTITAVVPTVRASLTLSDDLPTATVEIDRDTWRVVRRLAAAGESTPATSEDLAAALGCSELAAMRLARDLVLAGLVEVGPDVPAPMTTATLTDDGFATADAFGEAFADAGPDSFGGSFGGSFDDAFSSPFGDVDPLATPGHEAPAEAPAFTAPEPSLPTAPATDAFAGVAAPFDHAQLHRVAAEPLVHDAAAPAPVTEPPAAPAPDGDHVRSDLQAIFGTVDPFVADRPANPPSMAPGADPNSSGGTAGLDDPEADLARQLAMLSPRAAEAVASAESGGSLEDAERARVARFLGSV